MDQELARLEREILTDPASLESLSRLAQAYDRAGRRHHGKSYAEWYEQAASSDRRLRRAAIWALDDAGLVALPALIGALTDETSIALRERALAAFVALGPAAGIALAVLTERFESGDESDRARVVEALGALGASTPIVIPVLLRALNDPSEAVRILACEALSEVEGGDEQVLGALIERFDEDDWDQRFYARQALEKRAARAVPVMLAALADDRSRVRANAAWALGQLAAAEATPALRRLLDDEQAVWRAAEAALARIAVLTSSGTR